jgi:cardiolipin synthase
LELLRSGNGFFRTLRDTIDSATKEIHFQTYIFDPDRTGQQVLESLKAAAHRGVKVYLMLDAYGSSRFRGKQINEMVKAGVEIQFYGRLFHAGWFHLGRRLHRKVVVVDGKTAIVGGINISDKYDRLDDRSPWLDYAVLAEGPIAGRLQLVCRKRWMNIRTRRKTLRIRQEATVHTQEEEVPYDVRVTRNDFLRKRNEIAVSYRQAIRESRQSLVIVGGYFLPGGKVRRLLRAARRRGVEVRLLLAAKSDVMISVYARQYLYSWMLRNGIRVFEYLPSNVHGKVLVADNYFVSIGSYDLNNLSTYSNIELNLEVKDGRFAGQVATELDSVIRSHCREVDTETWKRNDSRWNRLRCWFSYRITKTLFGLSWLLAKSGTRG